MNGNLPNCSPARCGGATLEVRLPDPQRFRLGSGSTPIGRGADNSIQVDDPSVSSHHCEIIFGPDGAVIRDLGSTNGTFLGGQRVEIGPLNYGQPFRLANVECVLLELESSPATAMSVARPKSPRPKISRESWEALVIGVGMAVVIWLVPLLTRVIELLRVIIHEAGHTLTVWLFGHPSIPMLRAGGGLAVHITRPTWMVVLLLLAVGYVLFHVYRSRWHVVAVSIGAGVYLLCLFTDVRSLLITSMGHGAEVMVASLFLYRALSGRSIIVPVERPLYAAVASVIFGLYLRFAFKLLLEPEAEADYREGLDGLTNDMVKIAEEYLHVELRAVVLVYLILCLLAPAAVFLHHMRSQNRRLAVHLR